MENGLDQSISHYSIQGSCISAAQYQHSLGSWLNLSSVGEHKKQPAGVSLVHCQVGNTRELFLAHGAGKCHSYGGSILVEPEPRII